MQFRRVSEDTARIGLTGNLFKKKMANGGSDPERQEGKVLESAATRCVGRPDIFERPE